MPYEGEVASKSSHHDIVRNPEVAAFIGECRYLRQPSEREVEIAIARFQVPPPSDATASFEHVIAVDGSCYESSINDQLPSTKIGYVKIGCVLISTGSYGALRDTATGLVDPMRVARLKDGNTPLSFTLPSSNVLWGGALSVRDSFRKAVDQHLQSSPTRFNPNDAKTSLRTTLFHLAALRQGSLGTGDPNFLRIHSCPTCSRGPVEVRDEADPQFCPFCGANVYPADCLRVWEDVSDFQSNAEALSRTMLAIEHLLPLHYIRFLLESSPSLLSSLAVIVDGPLAIFGNPAWLHGPIMSFLFEVNRLLDSKGLDRLVLIGLQKSGQVVDHLHLLDRYLPSNRIFPLDDEYRYERVLQGRDPSANGFGSETYYGQDFLLKTQSGRVFAFALPYPFRSKISSGLVFPSAKVELGRYPDLSRAIALIETFESDLYENAVVPVALAHKYTAISLVPGGRVLDLLSRRHMTGV